MDVRLFCMRGETLKARCVLSRALFLFETIFGKNIQKIDGGLTVYCLIFVNSNILDGWLNMGLLYPRGFRRHILSCRELNPILLRNVCNLCIRALVCKSL